MAIHLGSIAEIDALIVAGRYAGSKLADLQGIRIALTAGEIGKIDCESLGLRTGVAKAQLGRFKSAGRRNQQAYFSAGCCMLFTVISTKTSDSLICIQTLDTLWIFR